MEENKLENTAQITSSNPQNNSQIAAAIIVAGLIIAGAIMLKGSGAPTPSGTPKNDNEPMALEARPISADDHILGNPNAKIIILEYSDLECPFCQVFHNTMKKVVSENENVAWVYRHYPITSRHPKAQDEAEATECAWEQGGNDAFWKYANRIFEISPTNNGLDLKELPKIAEYIGLNVPAFNSCLSSGRFKAKVQADVDDGAKMGVSGTPSSFILKDGKVVDTIGGAQKYETVVEKLKALK